MVLTSPNHRWGFLHACSLGSWLPSRYQTKGPRRRSSPVAIYQYIFYGTIYVCIIDSPRKHIHIPPKHMIRKENEGKGWGGDGTLFRGYLLEGGTNKQ